MRSPKFSSANRYAPRHQGPSPYSDQIPLHTMQHSSAASTNPSPPGSLLRKASRSRSPIKDREQPSPSSTGSSPFRLPPPVTHASIESDNWWTTISSCLAVLFCTSSNETEGLLAEFTEEEREDMPPGFPYTSGRGFMAFAWEFFRKYAEQVISMGRNV